MRHLWSRLNRWPDGWWGLVPATAVPFATAAFVGLVLLDDDPAYALPMAAAFALGGGLGQLMTMRWPRKAKPPAWPTEAAPPQRPD